MERLGRFYSYLTGRTGQVAAPETPANAGPAAQDAAVRIRVVPYVAPTLSQALAAPPPAADITQADFVAIDIHDPPQPADHVAIDIHDAPETPSGSDDEALEPQQLLIHSPPDHRNPAYQRDGVRYITRPDGNQYLAYVNDRDDIERAHMPAEARHSALRQRIAQQGADIARLDREIRETTRAQPAHERPLITSDQSRATGWRVGGQLALRDAVSQAVGRVSGLAVTAGMRVAAAGSDAAARHVAIGGSIALLGACAVFGSRMSELLVKGFNIRDRRELAYTAFLMTPLLLQAGLPLAGAYYGKAGTGVKLLATVVGRLVAALGRDGLTQCQTGLWSSAKVVRPDGQPADPRVVLNEMDPYRLKVAFVRYVASSLLLLVGGRALLERWITSDGSNSFEDLMRTGMASVVPSVLNEAFDGLNGALAQASAAIASGLALAPVAPKGCMPCNSLADWSDLASRIRSHAGARMVFGTFTSDPWILGAELSPDASAADLGFRLIGGMLNGLTEYRGHSVERGNRTAQFEAYRRDQAMHTVAQRREQAERDTIDAAIRHVQDSAQNHRFQQVRQQLFEQIKRSIIDPGLVQPGEMHDLDALIEEVFGADINGAAAQAFMAQSREAARPPQYEIYYGRNDGILEFVPIHHGDPPHESPAFTPIGSPAQQTPDNATPDSAQTSASASSTTSRQTTPHLAAQPAPRRQILGEPPLTDPAMPPGPQSGPQPGQNIRLNGIEVRVERFEASHEEHKGAMAGREVMVVSAGQEIELPDWPAGEEGADQRWIYRLPAGRLRSSTTPPRN